MDFGFNIERADGRTVIAVSGELDVQSAPQLRDELLDAIERGDRELFVDLAACEFIDSSGLSALVAALKRVRSTGGDLGLICPHGNVRRLIEVVALDQVFTMYEDAPAPD